MQRKFYGIFIPSFKQLTKSKILLKPYNSINFFFPESSCQLVQFNLSYASSYLTHSKRDFSNYDNVASIEIFVVIYVATAA
jgi:hypothetical protein